VHGFGAVAGQHGKVVHFAGGAGFHHQACGGAQAFAHQVLVNGRQASSAGMAIWVALTARSLMIRMFLPPLMASTADAHSEASLASTPSRPQAAG
jgi:hypothetical protein